MINNDFEKIKLVYPQLMEEMNRYRDWPIKILTFTSAFYFGIIGLILIYKIKIVNLWSQFSLMLVMTILFWWTIVVFVHCHLEYLNARNTQCNIQKYLKLNLLKIDEGNVFLYKWFKEIKVSPFERFLGWGFYVLYAAILWFITLLVILCGDLLSER